MGARLKKGSTGSVSPPVSHASLEASDAALPTAEPPPIVEHAELQPALPASIHLADSRAAEAATILTIFGVTLSSVPILSPPLQHDSAHSAPSVSDEEPSEAEVTPPGSLVNEPGPARSSSLPLQSSLTVQPNPISTSMQQGSNPVTSPTQQPPSTTLKAKGLRRVSSAFEGLKIKAFKRSISDSNPVVAHTAVTAQRRSGCWQWGATRRQTRRNTGQDRKFIPTIVGRAHCWRWLQGDFNLVQVVDGLCNATLKDEWVSWLGADPIKVNLLKQLVAHCVCRVPISRQQLVPGSQAAEAPTTWQDMENDGLAYVGEPGEGLESGDSGDSSSSNASQTQALGTAAPQPGYEPGSQRA
ncbi:hypothetical protein ABBQ38_008059 [Trebouxia sp. C0009 RCD-2024]